MSKKSRENPDISLFFLSQNTDQFLDQLSYLPYLLHLERVSFTCIVLSSWKSLLYFRKENGHPELLLRRPIFCHANAPFLFENDNRAGILKDATLCDGFLF